MNTLFIDELFNCDLPFLLCVIQDSNIIKANREFLKLSGHSANEILGKPLTDIFVNNAIKPQANLFYSDTTSQEEKPYVAKLVSKKGDTYYLLRTDSVIQYENRSALLAYFTNISLRKEIEFRLGESNEKLERMYDSLADGVTVTDYQGRITEINGRAVSLHGYSNRREMIGSSAYNFVAPFDHKRMRQNINNALLKGVSREVAFTFIRKDKSEFLVELTTSVLHNDAGKAIGFIGVTRDITQRKLYEETLRNSERFNANLLSNSPIPIIVINPDTSIRYVNPALEYITGYKSHELIGIKFPYPWWINDIYNETKRFHQEGIKKGRAKAENIFKNKNGNIFRVENTFIAVPDKRQLHYYISSWVDITKQIKLQENMRVYIREITRAQEDERKRIARELHDETLQTLIGLCMDIDDITAAESGLSKVNLRRLGEFRGKIRSAAEEIRRFSHELRPEVLDRFGLIPSLEVLIQELTSKGLINCELIVSGNEIRLKPESELVLFRITQEALNNIRKHAEATSVVVELVFYNNEMDLKISDNGTGFNYQTPSINPQIGKVGIMGMKERINQCNGTLKINTKPGEGTTIIARLPL